MFELDRRLGDDTLFVTDLALCRVLLMDDRQYPWIVLAPRRDSVREIMELNAADRSRLMDEIVQASTVMTTLFDPRKLNVAALGNSVPQLHVHVVARFQNDPAWPKPVWGAVPAKAYAEDAADALIRQMEAAFAVA